MPERSRTGLIQIYPGKAIYTTTILIIYAAKLPLWMLYYIIPGFRPNPKWTWRQALRVRIVRAFLYWGSSVEMVTPFDLQPGKEGDQWATISPAEDKYYTGVATNDPKIRPVKIGATWYPSIPTQATTKVVLHFHGGAFVIGDGRIHDAGFLGDTIVKHANTNYVCAVNYRLASNLGGRFPAALQDAISSYVYLTNTLKIKPRDIVVSGDSAGGNLVLTFLKYILDNGKTVGIQTPGAAFLWSPWVDPVGGTDLVRYWQSPNEPTDYINPGFPTWGARCYMPLKETELTNSYIDFQHHAFKTETPLWFSIGESEMLLHDVLETTEAFKKVGNHVTVSIEENCIHDTILVGKKTSFDKEAEAAARKAGAWLKKLDWEKVRE